MKYKTVELHNVWDIQKTEDGDGFQTCRYPLEILPDIFEGAKNRSWAGAGCEIRGMLPPGGEAKIVIEPLDTDCVPTLVEVYFGSFFDQVITLPKGKTEIVIKEPNNWGLMAEITRDRNLPFAHDLVRVLLPHLIHSRIHSIEGDLTYPETGSTPEKTMLSYGSSITHGAHAFRASGTYASQTALHLGCDLINLGVGGSARMDDAIAKHIAARDDWNFATFEMGINVRSIWSADEFKAAVDNFVTTVHTAQPDKPLFCIDLFTNNCDFMTEPEWGVGFREAVSEIVAKQNSDKVFHVDGRDILTDPAGLRPDLVHPGPDGMAEMGANLARVISDKYADSNR
jgi:hypothetical protein